MSDFKAKMHRIRWGFPLGQLTAPPDPLAVFKGPTSKDREREGQGGKSHCSWIFVGTWKEKQTPLIFETWLRSWYGDISLQIYCQMCQRIC